MCPHGETIVDEVDNEQATQSDGKKPCEDEECYATQIVPPQDPQAILRFKESNPTTQVAQQEFHIQLPVDLNTEVFINLGRLKQSENPNSSYQQFVHLFDPNRPANKQIIS